MIKYQMNQFKTKERKNIKYIILYSSIGKTDQNAFATYLFGLAFLLLLCIKWRVNKNA